MKKQIIFLVVLSLAFSFSVNAGPGGTGGIGTVPTLRMNAEMRSMANELRFNRNQLEALSTHSGDYARFEDLAEGFVRFKGATIRGETVHIDLNNPELEVDTVLLNTGVSHYFGGDMGGGSKQVQSR
jgi:hypothetical protein